MPYTIVPQGEKFCVFKKDSEGKPTGSSLGCHDTQKEAVAQIGAIESQESKELELDFVAVVPPTETGTIDMLIVKEETQEVPHVEEAPAPKEEASSRVSDVDAEVAETEEKAIQLTVGKSFQDLLDEVDKSIKSIRDSETWEKGTLAPQVDIAGECFCGECGHSAPHTTGEPCVDKFCPNCSATMMARSAKKESLLMRVRNVLYSVGDRARELMRPSLPDLSNLIIDGVQDTGSAFFTVKQKDGRFRWVGISSTAFLDRTDEIVSTTALQKSALLQIARGPLLFWHEPEIELGSCDFSLFDGMCLIESGLWHDNDVGKAARISTEKNPDRWKMSIKFYPYQDATFKNVKVGSRTVTTVYDEIHIVERSQLPAEFSANVFSRIDTQGGITMQAEKKQALAELLGDDVASRFEVQVDSINAMVADKSAVFKDIPNEAIALKYKEMAARTENQEEKLLLEKAAEMISRPSTPPTEEEKDTMVRDGLAILMESLPECEAKSTVLAALTEKAGHSDEDEEGDDDANEEKAVQSENAKTSADANESIVLALKALVSQVTALSHEMTILKSEGETRGSAVVRPSQSPENVNPSAPITVMPGDAPLSKTNQILDEIANAARRTVFGTEVSSG